jgi:hypothetical protein
MSTYTAVLAGGNWNVNATWLPATGFPVAGDTAILNATSGPVTVTTNVACLILDCTGYLNTLTINTGFTLNVFGIGATISLGGTISILQQGVISTANILIASTAVTINFNGFTIPRLTIGYAGGGNIQTVTVNGITPTVENLIVSNGGGGGTARFAGTTLNISSSLNVINGLLDGNSFNFSGALCTVTTSAAISSGFTVLNGCTLSLSSNLLIRNGVYTFNLGSALIHNNRTLVLSPNVGCTLNTSLVTWYDISDTSARTTLTSDLNISRNLTIANAGGTFVGSGGTRSININGNLSVTSGGNINASNTIINLNGSGIWDGSAGSGFGSTTININTSGYTIGSATRNGLFLFRSVINLVGLNTCTVNTGHTLSIGATSAPNLSTLNTNNTGTGGFQIIWENLSFNTNTVISLTNETTFAKNLTALGTGTAGINGAKLFLGGNLTGSVNQQINGTSTIEFTGSTNATWAAGSYQNNIIVSKSSGAVVTAGTAISWGFANRIFTINTNVNFLTNNTTFTLSGNPLTINNSSASQFFNMTVPSNTTLTLGGSTTTPITGTLSLLGSATFAGTAGWTCGTWLCSVSAAVITLQAGVTYTTTTNVTMLGAALANRIRMVSSAPTTTYAIWTLQNPASQSMTYVSGQGIDSNAGMTIYSFGGDITTSLVPLNWGLGASQGTKAFTFVS